VYAIRGSELQPARMDIAVKNANSRTSNCRREHMTLSLFRATTILRYRICREYERPPRFEQAGCLETRAARFRHRFA
jgi:hypothetical protein